MSDPARLLDQEAEAWDRLTAVLASCPGGRRREPSVTPDGWSVHVVIVHAGAWLDDCARVLGRIALSTWDPATAEEETAAYVERVNATHAERARGMTDDEADEWLHTSRERARSAFTGLTEHGRDAWGWFEESGPMHYAKHEHDLRAWLAGAPPDPDVGPLLQGETDAWLTFRVAVDAVAPDVVLDEPPGWTVADVTFHMTAWMRQSAADIEANRGWGHDDDPDEDAIVDAMNAGFLADGRTHDQGEARAQLDRARTLIRAAFAGLPSPSGEAKDWFAANGVQHYAEHIEPLLRAGR